MRNNKWLAVKDPNKKKKKKKKQDTGIDDRWGMKTACVMCVQVKGDDRGDKAAVTAAEAVVREARCQIFGPVPSWPPEWHSPGCHSASDPSGASCGPCDEPRGPLTRSSAFLAPPE